MAGPPAPSVPECLPECPGYPPDARPRASPGKAAKIVSAAAALTAALAAGGLGLYFYMSQEPADQTPAEGSVLNGKGLAVSDGTVTTTVDLDGKRMKFEVAEDANGLKSTFVRTSGGSWLQIITRTDTVRGITYDFVVDCHELNGEEGAGMPVPDLSFFFPENRSTLTLDGENLIVDTGNGTNATVPLREAVFGEVEATATGSHSSGIADVDAHAFDVPAACSGRDGRNDEVKSAYHKALADKDYPDLANMTGGKNLRRRLVLNQDNCRYCGPDVEGCQDGDKDCGGPKSAIDACCAYHDFGCSDTASGDVGDYRGPTGTSMPSKNWVAGAYGDDNKAAHCECERKLVDCAIDSFWNSAEKHTAAAVFWAFWHIPCWYSKKVTVSVPCGTKTCSKRVCSWWGSCNYVYYPCVKWCSDSVEEVIPSYPAVYGWAENANYRCKGKSSDPKIEWETTFKESTCKKTSKYESL